MTERYPSAPRLARSRPGKGLVLFLAVFGFAIVAQASPEQIYDVNVDFTDAIGPVNRGVFSLVNHQRLYAEGSPLARQTFSYLNPAGSMSRIETMIHLMEPSNDNADPQSFNWDAFNERHMFRFVDDREDRYISDVRSMGMEPLILLTYNAPWLTDIPGDLNRPPTNPEEWAEFAAAVVESINGDPDSEDWELRVRYLEVWNEPSADGLYWHGTRQEYMELFRTVAERIHRDYPGVLVGGPAVLGSEGPFLMDFVESCGDVADFYTMHLYNELPNLTVRKATDWLRYIRRETDNPDVDLMVTEGDQWYMLGAEKREYLLVRQFELLEQDATLHSFHHFSLPYYAQTADWRFGLIHLDGSVVDKNYWPYWFFRHHHGERVATSVSQDTRVSGDRRGGDTRGVRRKYPRNLYVDASRHADGDGRQVLVYYYPGQDGESSEPARARISIELGDVPENALLAIERVDGYGHAIESVERLVADTTRIEREIAMRPRTAYAVRVIDPSEALGMDTIVADITVPRSTSRPAEIDGMVTTLAQSRRGTLVLQSLDGSYRISLGDITVEPYSGARFQFETDVSEMRDAGVSALQVVLETDEGERFSSVAERMP